MMNDLLIFGYVIMSFTGDYLEKYLRQSRKNHQALFNSGSIVFSNNYISYKMPKFYEDALAYLEYKTCLDLPFDIVHLANFAINSPHYHVHHYNETCNTLKQVYLVKVDLAIGINIVNVHTQS